MTNTGTSASVTASEINTLKVVVPNAPLKSLDHDWLQDRHGAAQCAGDAGGGRRHDAYLHPDQRFAVQLAWTTTAGDYGRVAMNAGFVGTSVFTGNAGVKLTATYKYQYTTGTPVPEPGSFALIGAGLVGLSVLRRRRRG